MREKSLGKVGGKCTHRAAFVLSSPFLSLKVKWEIKNKAKNKALLLIPAR